MVEKSEPEAGKFFIRSIEIPDASLDAHKLALMCTGVNDKSEKENQDFDQDHKLMLHSPKGKKHDIKASHDRESIQNISHSGSSTKISNILDSEIIGYSLCDDDEKIGVFSLSQKQYDKNCSIYV